MASERSSKYKHQWPDGTWHTETWFEHQAKQQAKHALGNYGRPGGPQSAADLPGFPGGPPASPGSVVPPGVPQPFDAGLAQRTLDANLNVGLADAEAAYQRGTTAYDSGYDANGQRNMANPYAQAQLLEDNYRRSLLGAQNSYAAMGQYNSGAYGRAKGREDRLYAQGSDRLQRDTMDRYHGIGAGQLQGYASNSLGVSGESYAALKRSIYGS